MLNQNMLDGISVLTFIILDHRDLKKFRHYIITNTLAEMMILNLLIKKKYKGLI